MTEKYKQKIEEEPKYDWWGNFLKELKKKYAETNTDRENGESDKDTEVSKGSW